MVLFSVYIKYDLFKEQEANSSDFHMPPVPECHKNIPKKTNIRQVVSKQETKSFRSAFSIMIATITTQQLIPSGRMSSLSNQLLYSGAQAGSQSDMN